MIEASCLCGDCRWEADGPIALVPVCHCSRCRREFGASFAVTGGVPEAGFRWVCGEDRALHWESAPGLFRGSCLRCGSPLPGEPNQGHVFMPLGCVEGDPGARPQLHLFAGSRAPWHEITDELPRFDALPPGYDVPPHSEPERPQSEPGCARGSCLCNETAWELEGGFTLMRHCHCSRCRKARGTAYATNAVAPLEGFRWLRGEEVGSFHVPGARFFRQDFCRGCGSPAPRVDAERGIVVVPGGCIDGDPGVRPREHIWVGSKAPWVEIGDDLPQHPEGPPPA